MLKLSLSYRTKKTISLIKTKFRIKTTKDHGHLNFLSITGYSLATVSILHYIMRIVGAAGAQD